MSTVQRYVHCSQCGFAEADCVYDCRCFSEDVMCPALYGSGEHYATAIPSGWRASTERGSSR